MGKLFGYVRVSTGKQSTDLQRDALIAHGVAAERITAEPATSGVRVRVQLERLLSIVGPGDVLVVYSLSRIGRSAEDILRIVRVLGERGATLRSLSESIDTGSPMGRAFLTIAAAFAQLERETLIERTCDGLAAAKARGQRLGRPRGVTSEQVELARQRLRAGESMKATAALLKVDRTTLWRALRA